MSNRAERRRREERRKRRKVLIGVVAGFVVVAVIGGVAFLVGSGDAVAENAVRLDEWSITGDLEVPVGTTLHVDNVGTIAHDFVVPNGPRTPMLDAGESVDLDLGNLAPGRYDVVCSVVHHEEEGMHAQLVVTAARGE